MGIGSNQMMQTSGFTMPEQYVQPMFPSYAQYNAPFQVATTNARGRKAKEITADKQPSQVEQMIARAQAAYNNINPATLAELFPSLSPALQQSMGQVDMSSGAGRFLGGNAPVMAPQQMSYGYTPQQSALLNSLMNPGMNMTSGANQGMGGMATPQFSFNTQA
jgi:hypothetical protein